ncbi:MAG: HmuY family protein [Myxococcota bacterium]
MVRTGSLALTLALAVTACGGDDPELDNGTGTAGQPDLGTGTGSGNGTGNGSGNGAGNGMTVDMGGTEDMGSPVDMGEEPMLCELDSAECTDEQIVELRLFEEVSDAMVTNEALAGGGYRSVIDTTGGGLSPTEAYVYVRFTNQGLEKVEVSDFDAFESGAWDIGARRFVVRLNSGVSGPSCIEAARTAPDTEFETLTTEPEGLQYRTEAYFTTPDCTIVSDGSGIGSPGTALSSYWTYRGCVEMTGNVYVVKLADGRSVKMEFETYYSPDVQAACNANGRLPGGGPSGSGNMTILWGFLD